MSTRQFACALVGSVLLACGARPDLLYGGPSDTTGSTKDAGTPRDPATRHDAAVGPDAPVTSNADDAADGPTPVEDAGNAPDAQPQLIDCVDIDLSSYDRWCHSDSDCMLVRSGVSCPSDCLCPNAAINVDGRMRYEVTIAPARSTRVVCNCPNEPAPSCNKGECTF